MAKQSEPTLLKLLRSKKLNHERSQSHAASFSPDGRLLAVACSTGGFANTFKNKVRIWDLSAWKLAAEFAGCSEGVDGVAFTADGKSLVCVGSTDQRFMGGEIQVWNAKTWKSTRTIEQDELYSLRRVACSPDGKWIATGSAISSEGKKLRLWDRATGKHLREFGTLADDVQDMTFSPDGKLLAVGCAGDRSVSVWTVPGGKKRWQTRAHTEAYHITVRFSPDGKRIASCGDKNVAVWDVKTGKRLLLLKDHRNSVRSLCYSDGGEHLLSAAYGELRIWNAADGAPLGEASLEGMHFIALRWDQSQGKLFALHTINDVILVQEYALDVALLTPPAKTKGAAPAVQPPSAQAGKFLKAILAQPDDDAPRLEYAAWLTEQQDPRGEFIQVQCELAQAEKRPSSKLRNREKKLLKDNFAAWTAALADLQVKPDDCEFRRGFLWKLRLNDISVTDKSLQALAAYPELEQLDLSGTNVTDKCLPALAMISSLRNIELSETKVTAKALPQLDGLKRLVLVHNYRWGNQRIPEIEKLKEARNRRFLKLPKSEQRAEAIRVLKLLIGYFPDDKKGNYPWISYSQTWASNADLVYLQAFPEVEELDFFECRAVDQKGIKHLEKLPNLKRLRLSESGVTDLAPLAKLTKLEALSLDSLEKLEPASFRHLPKLKKLRTLACRFTDLGDEVADQLAKCPALEELDVIYNKFSDKAIERLGKLGLKKFEHD